MPTTSNRGFEVPTRGSEVGTWDVPVNGNMEALDDILGAFAPNIPLTSVPYTLSADEQRHMGLRFTGTLSANIAVTMNMPGFYIVENNCNVGAFRVQLRAAGVGESISLPPGETIDIYFDGTNVRFRNLGRLGQMQFWYTDTLPSWVNFCTVKPFLLLDGSAFVSADYPQLFRFLGSATLPDFRSRVPVPLDNMGTGAAGIIGTVNTGNGVIVGANIGTFGGSPLQSLGITNLPSHNHGGVTGSQVVPHTHPYLARVGNATVGSGNATGVTRDDNTTRNTDQPSSTAHTHSIPGQGSNVDHNNMQPSRMAGIFVIKT